jgi:hypothetical protein
MIILCFFYSKKRDPSIYFLRNQSFTQNIFQKLMFHDQDIDDISFQLKKDHG